MYIRHPLSNKIMSNNKQSTMSSVGSPLLLNANPLPYNHVPCPTCVDRVLDKSEVAGCGNCIFCECCDFACPEWQCQWDKMEELVEHYMETDLVQLRLDNDTIPPGQRGFECLSSKNFISLHLKSSLIFWKYSIICSTLSMNIRRFKHFKHR